MGPWLAGSSNCHEHVKWWSSCSPDPPGFSQSTGGFISRLEYSQDIEHQDPLKIQHRAQGASISRIRSSQDRASRSSQDSIGVLHLLDRISSRHLTPVSLLLFSRFSTSRLPVSLFGPPQIPVSGLHLVYFRRAGSPISILLLASENLPMAIFKKIGRW